MDSEVYTFTIALALMTPVVLFPAVTILAVTTPVANTPAAIPAIASPKVELLPIKESFSHLQAVPDSSSAKARLGYPGQSLLRGNASTETKEHICQT